jgi:hypothetical protein
VWFIQRGVYWNLKLKSSTLGKILCVLKMTNMVPSSIRFMCLRFSLGKDWQIRSVLIDNSTWRIFPFIVNTGGALWNLPIISEGVTTLCGIDRSVMDLDRDHSARFYMPVPLGRITRPLKAIAPPILRHPLVDRKVGDRDLLL